MQGALLDFAQLEGAVLRDANLEAASLQQARLIGTDMSGMKMAGSDLRGAIVWLTQPPVWDSTGLTDLSELAVRAPADTERASMQASLQRMGGDDDLRRKGQELTAQLAEKDATWSGTLDQQRWQYPARTHRRRQPTLWSGTWQISICWRPLCPNLCAGFFLTIPGPCI